MGKRSKKRVGSAKTDASVVAAAQWPEWLNRDSTWGWVLMAMVLLAYSPVFWARFIWDDVSFITANPVIVGPQGLKEIWTTRAADICPLTLSTFWLEHQLWGLNAFAYHLVNVCLHGACAVLLWQVLRSLRLPGAWLGAALWALHPVMVESVAFVLEMKNTESALFFLLALFFFVKGARGAWDRNYALTLLFSALAMASKSSTVILPAMLCLAAWWVEGRWQWRNLIRVAPIFLMSIAASAMSIWTQKFLLAKEAVPEVARAWTERLINAGDAVWFYLGKLIWPYPLSAIYPRNSVDPAQWTAYLPLLAVIVVLFVLWLKRESWSQPWFFVFAYFLVALLPALGLVDNTFFRYALVADHFQYLAAMGPLALAAVGMVRLGDLVIPGKQLLQATLAGVVLLILAVASWQRATVYENEETLWTDVLAKNPDFWEGHNDLGLAFAQNGQLDEAAAEFQKALQLSPTFAKGHSNLGNVLLRKGQFSDAVAEYQKALEMDPHDPAGCLGLGNAYFQMGRFVDAIAQFEEALKIDPEQAEAHNNLGTALLQKGRIGDAIAEYREALKITPTDADTHSNLGRALFKNGQVDEAIAQFQEALRLNPESVSARNNLAALQELVRQRSGAP